MRERQERPFGQSANDEGGKGAEAEQGGVRFEGNSGDGGDEDGGGSGDSGAAGAGDGVGGSAGDPGGSGEPGGSKDGADVSPLAGTGDAAHPFAVLAATACAAAAAMGAAAFARIAPEPAGDRTRRSGRRIGLADDDSAEQAESRGRR